MSDGALDVLAGLVLADGRRWGDAATDSQWSDARAVLGGARRLSFLTRPRGASKTTDLAGVGIAALVEQAPPRARLYGAAVDADQAGLLVDALGGFVARTPGLGGLLRVEKRTVTHVESGATLEVIPADAASAFGLLPWLLIVDEYAQWPSTSQHRRLWSALFSALPKVPGSRLVVLTSAGDPASPAGRLLERARGSRRWHVSEWPGPCPWADPDDLAEQRAELPPWEFDRLHGNRWVASADRLASIEDLRACVCFDGPREAVAGGRYAIGLDVGLRHDRTVAAVCRATSDGGRQVVELARMAVWEGSRADPVSLDAVEAWLVQAAGAYNGARVVADPWQAALLVERLRRRGVQAVEYPFSQQSVGRLAVRLFQLVRDRALRLPDDAALLDELAHVRLLEPAPGVYRLDHDPGRHDDRAIALALAAHHLLDGGPRPAAVASAVGMPLPKLGDGPPMAGGWSLGRRPGAQLPRVAGPR